MELNGKLKKVVEEREIKRIFILKSFTKIISFSLFSLEAFLDSHMSMRSFISIPTISESYRNSKIVKERKERKVKKNIQILSKYHSNS